VEWTPFPPVVGTVETWHDGEGWGVLRTPDGLSVFCHFSNVEMDGPKALVAGTSVWFDYETPGQDGCDARVLTAARPGLADADRPLGSLASAQPLSGMVQRATITFLAADDGRTTDVGGDPRDDDGAQQD
jgi:cold shock CspA family protein